MSNGYIEGLDTEKFMFWFGDGKLSFVEKENVFSRELSKEDTKRLFEFLKCELGEEEIKNIVNSLVYKNLYKAYIELKEENTRLYRKTMPKVSKYKSWHPDNKKGE